MRKSKNKPSRQDRDKEGRAKTAAFPSPFKGLKALLAKGAMEKRKEAAATRPPAHEPLLAAPDDESALREAFAGVRPLGATGQRLPVKAPVNSKNAVLSEEAEVLARLYDLVSGQGGFDLTETEEYVEGARVGLDPRLISRLRRGEFPVQAHIDLHGMVQPDAKEALTSFILGSVRKGLRTVLVVHGRGLRSPGGHPILKHATVQWLSHGVIGGHVLGFTTARLQDGGAGAMYVLLRRDRRRAAFDILHGAKRRD